jgi:hypothetical protein
VNCTSFDGRIVACRACKQTAELSPATVTFLQRAKELWPGADVVLRQTGRMRNLLERHDAHLRRRGDYDIITATLDENYEAGAEGNGRSAGDGNDE